MKRENKMKTSAETDFVVAYCRFVADHRGLEPQVENPGLSLSLDELDVCSYLLGTHRRLDAFDSNLTRPMLHNLLGWWDRVSTTLRTAAKACVAEQAVRNRDILLAAGVLREDSFLLAA